MSRCNQFPQPAVWPGVRLTDTDRQRGNKLGDTTWTSWSHFIHINSMNTHLNFGVILFPSAGNCGNRASLLSDRRLWLAGFLSSSSRDGWSYRDRTSFFDGGDAVGAFAEDAPRHALHLWNGDMHGVGHLLLSYGDKTRIFGQGGQTAHFKGLMGKKTSAVVLFILGKIQLVVFFWFL